MRPCMGEQRSPTIEVMATPVTGAHPDASLSSEQVETLHRMLIAKRSELRREHADHIDSARFSERIAEPEEAAAQDASQATMIDLAEAERLRLMEVDRAFAQMAQGTYGVSQESGAKVH